MGDGLIAMMDMVWAPSLFALPHRHADRASSRYDVAVQGATEQQRVLGGAWQHRGEVCGVLVLTRGVLQLPHSTASLRCCTRLMCHCAKPPVVQLSYGAAGDHHHRQVMCAGIFVRQPAS